MARNEPPSRELEEHLDRCDECRELAAAAARLGPAEASRSGVDATLVPELIPVGAKLGRYIVRGTLGMGGMGVVLEAYDPQLERVVALKVVRGLHDSTAWGRRARGRVSNEARAMARVAHPNIVAIYELIEIGGNQVIVMEHVAGTDLTAWLRTKPPWRERVRVALEAGEGLATAHDAGIIHGDVKPANILIGTDGRARVADFGLAALDTAASGLGTPGFAAPELAGGAKADARCDQYSYAITLWRMLLETKPDSDDNHPIARALRRALSREPSARYRTMRRLLGALRAASSPPMRIWRAMGGLTVVTVLAAGITWWLAAKDRDEPTSSISAYETAREAEANQAIETLTTYVASSAMDEARTYAPIAEQAIAGADRDPERDGALANLTGLVALDRGDGETAVRSFRIASEAAERLGAGHELELASALHNLGRALASTQRSSDATAAYTRSIVVLESVHAGNSMLVVPSLYQLAELAFSLEQSDDAFTYASRAVEIIEREHATDARSGYARFLLARVLWDRGRHDEARRLATRARDSLLDARSPTAPTITTWLDAHP